MDQDRVHRIQRTFDMHIVNYPIDEFEAQFPFKQYGLDYSHAHC